MEYIDNLKERLHTFVKTRSGEDMIKVITPYHKHAEFGGGGDEICYREDDVVKMIVAALAVGQETTK